MIMIPLRDRFRRRSALLVLTVVVAGVQVDQTAPQRGVGLLAPAGAAEDAPIDMRRLRPLVEKFRAGERLTPEEQAYVDRARRQMRSRAGQPLGKAGPPGAGWGTVDTSGLVPLTDMTARYKGEDGGLYGGGRNAPPEAHLAAYLKECQRIEPLDADGRPATDGKIGLVTIGFSNTHLESAEFKRTADSDPQKSPRKYDGMVWSEKDVRADDRLHPSEEGCRKITAMLLDFLKTDPGTRRWFVNPAAGDVSNPRLNYDPARGRVTAPLLLWGFYLWENATTPRKSDGLVWERSDYGEMDGMHPSPSGKQKVAQMLLSFFKTDPLARGWFVNP
jgi:hypothetical protein